ncbi:MAG: IS110 family transposase [Methanocella sp.]
MCLNKACGVDVHRDTFVACIRNQDDNLLEATFDTTGEGLNRLKEWIGENGCRTVAFESTGVYWRSLYNVLNADFDVLVANPAKIKKPPASKFKKSDRVDAKWISTLCLSKMIPESRVFVGDDYDLRELTRFHEILVRASGQFKNRAHRVLEVSNVKIASVLSDVFGLNGRKMLDSLVEGKNAEMILAEVENKRVKKKEEALRKALSTGLDGTSRLLLKSCLHWIRLFEEAIVEIENEIMRMLVGKKEELRIIMTIPGFGFVSSATVLAEIGDASDFPDGDQLASWAGLVPSMFQSGDKKVYGRITKHGSKYLRRMLIQIAHVISRMDNNLSRFFHRIAEKKGPKKAASALARKLLTIIHHLLVNKEYYEEPTVKPKKVRLPRVTEINSLPSIEEMIALLRETGRVVSDLPERPVKRRGKSRLSGSP